jgi:hypothetical protein
MKYSSGTFIGLRRNLVLRWAHNISFGIGSSNTMKKKTAIIVLLHLNSRYKNTKEDREI